jgi:parvulin-like peptidyl-prolyl isomerase
MVNEEPITMEEFTMVLSMAHEGRNETTMSGTVHYDRALQRLITTKLIVQEARSMGLDELPEVREMFDTFRKRTLRDHLRKDLVKSVVVDEAEVERQYRESIKEFTMRSVMFMNEKDAQAMVDAVAAGKRYADLAEAALASGAARGNREAEKVKATDLNPEIIEELKGAEPGTVCQPVAVGSGFVVFKIEDIRYVDSAETKQQVRQDLLAKEETKELVKQNQKLAKKYLTFNEKLIKSVDFREDKAGMEKLLKDKRVLVQVKGDTPITVGDLAKAMEEKLYHGSKNIKKDKLNKQKPIVLEELAGKRVFLREALSRGLDQTKEYRNSVRDYEDSVLFGIFVQKIIVPTVLPKDEELQAYYDQHLGEYQLPPVVTLDSLAFSRKSDAEDALDKARKGTELRWLKANLPGQVSGSDPDALRFEGTGVSMDNLPAEVKAALADARSGDVRLAAGTPKYFYVLFVRDVMPSRAMPFEQAKDSLARKVFEEKLRKALDEWSDKLKAASDVKIYLTTAAH